MLNDDDIAEMEQILRRDKEEDTRYRKRMARQDTVLWVAYALLVVGVFVAAVVKAGV